MTNQDAYNWTILIRIVCWGIAFYFAAWYNLRTREIPTPSGMRIFGAFCLLSGIIQTILMVQWITLKIM
jgi:hypothetical protein